MKKLAALALLVSFCAPGPAWAGLKLPDASPGASVKAAVGATEVTIDYHRPGVKGRKIWGGLVPYGQVWRLGANAATTITFTDPIKVQGHEVPAGTYALFAIPGQDKWTLILSRKAKQWGAFFYKPEDDLLRFDVQPQTGPFTEWMVFQITPDGNGKAVAEMAWETLRVPFTLEVDADAIAWKSVDDTLAGTTGWEDYQTAAEWALIKNQRLDEAMAWVNKAMELQESFWNYDTKAKLLQRAGKTEEALRHLEKAMELAAGKAPKAYLDVLEQRKAEWKKGG